MNTIEKIIESSQKPQSMLRSVFQRLMLIVEKHSNVSFACFLVFLGIQVFAFSVTKPLWHDEIFTLFISNLSSPVEIYSTLLNGTGDSNPPLYFFITHLALKVFGESVYVVRLPAMLSILSALWLFHLLAKKYVNVWCSLLAVLLVSLSHLHFIATEARYYAFMIFLGMLALYTWCKWGESKKILWLVLCGLSLTLSFYTHFYGCMYFVLFALMELAETLWAKKIRWHVWGVFLVSGLLCLGLIPLILYNSGYREGFHFAPSMRNLEISFSSWVFYQNMQLAAVFSIISMGAFFFLGLKSEPNKTAFPDGFKRMSLGLVLFAILPFFGYLLAKVYTNAFYPNYFVINILAILLICSVAVSKLGKQFQVLLLFPVGLIALLQFAVVAKNALGGSVNPSESTSRIIDETGLDYYFTSSKQYVKNWYYLDADKRGRIHLLYDFYSDFSEQQKAYSPFLLFADRFGIETMSVHDMQEIERGVIHFSGNSDALKRIQAQGFKCAPTSHGLWKFKRK